MTTVKQTTGTKKMNTKTLNIYRKPNRNKHFPDNWVKKVEFINPILDTYGMVIEVIIGNTDNMTLQQALKE